MDPSSRLQALLAKSDLAEVARATGVPLRTLYRLASGETAAPAYKNLIALLLWADGRRVPRKTRRRKPGPVPKDPPPKRGKLHTGTS